MGCKIIQGEGPLVEEVYCLTWRFFKGLTWRTDSSCMLASAGHVMGFAKESPSSLSSVRPAELKGCLTHCASSCKLFSAAKCSIPSSAVQQKTFLCLVLELQLQLVQGNLLEGTTYSCT